MKSAVHEGEAFWCFAKIKSSSYLSWQKYNCANQGWKNFLPLLPKVQLTLFENIGPISKTKVHPILLLKFSQTSFCMVGQTMKKGAGHFYHYASWPGHWLTKLGCPFGGWPCRDTMGNPHLGIYELLNNH